MRASQNRPEGFPLRAPVTCRATRPANARRKAWKLARDPERKSLTGALGILWGFAWVHQEIADAFSATVSTLLRVTYYAATSVAAVWTGRAKKEPMLRHTGLGLAIAHELVAGHGGTIAVEDGVPSGARFIVRLPLDPPHSDLRRTLDA